MYVLGALERLNRAPNTLETEVMDGCKPLCGFWEEQEMLVTTNPSLQLQN